MTITTTINRRVYAGAGIVGPFPVDFKFLINADIKVSKTLIATGVATILAEGADYVLTGAGVDAGGVLNLTVALDPAYKLTIYRDPVQDQQTQFPPNDKFPAKANENAIDKLTMLCQRFLDVFARTARLPDTDVSGADPTLPVPLANATLGWDATGMRIINYLAVGVLAVTGYGQTLLNAANAAAARAVLLSGAAGDAIFTAVTQAAARIAAGFSAIAAKGDLFAGTAANTIGTLTVGADGQVLAADSSKVSGFQYIDNPSRPNLLINPNWQLDQINEGALYTVIANSVVQNGPDGWSGLGVNGTPGVVKLRTVVDPDNVALKCMEITCTTIDAAIAAGDNYHIFAAVEGYDAASLMVGTASAQSATLQFKFKTSVAGVYGVSLANSAKNRSYVGIINVADANEHEYSLIVPMDTAGTWLYTNGVGLYLRLTLAAGANFQAVAGAWNAADNYCTAAQANFMSSVANIAYLKRIQLIPGALVQAYRPADFQKELAKAQRYWEKSYNIGIVPGSVTGAPASAVVCCVGATPSNGWLTDRYEVNKRAVPTVTTFSTISGASGNVRNLSAATDVASTVNSPGMAGHVVDFAGALNNEYNWQWTSNARLS